MKKLKSQWAIFLTKALEVNGGPMKPRPMIRLAIELGLKINCKEPERVVYRPLRKYKDLFYKLDSGEWDLVQRESVDNTLEIVTKILKTYDTDIEPSGMSISKITEIAEQDYGLKSQTVSVQELISDNLDGAIKHNNIQLVRTKSGEYRLRTESEMLDKLDNMKKEILKVNIDTKKSNSYNLEDIESDGCFIPLNELRKLKEKLEKKKNLILQGPPGTGKTWLAKKLAYAVMGERNDDKIVNIQFHSGYTYEDFIRGRKPRGNGEWPYEDGIFLKSVDFAINNSNSSIFVIIDEINRANLGKVFGETITLIETDKRDPDEALLLSSERSMYVPENLYIIGTMNLADRSDSLFTFDMATKRRFAIFNLRPRFGKEWSKWVHEKSEIEETFLDIIRENMKAVNEYISGDDMLGENFQIGHSYVSPNYKVGKLDQEKWFESVVENEILPIIEANLFDSSSKVEKLKEMLLNDVRHN